MEEVPAVLGTGDPSLREAGICTHPVFGMVDAKVWDEVRGEFEAVKGVRDVDTKGETGLGKNCDFSCYEADVIRGRGPVGCGLINSFTTICDEADLRSIKEDVFSRRSFLGDTKDREDVFGDDA